METGHRYRLGLISSPVIIYNYINIEIITIIHFH